MFNSKSPKDLIDRSAKALSTFRKVVEDLNSINVSANDGVNTRKTKVAELNMEINDLDKLVQDNSNIITNINNIIGV